MGRFIFIELKYFNPRFIKDKNSEYTLKRTDWTFINHKEKVSEYTRIDSVIYCGEIACNFPPMKDVDIESFEILPGTDYARDKNNIYYPISISCDDFTDCGVCYCVDYIIKNADPKTFRYLDKEYATDKESVYFRGEFMPEADGQTFKVIKGPKYLFFGLDKYNVYRHDVIFSEADPSTFYYDGADERTRISNHDSRYIIGDKNNEWIYDPPTRIKKVEKR